MHFAQRADADDVLEAAVEQPREHPVDGGLEVGGGGPLLEADPQPGDRYLFSPGWSYWLVGYYWPAPDGSVVTTIDGLASGTRVWLIDLDRAGRDAVEDGVVVSRHPLANAEVVELRVG